MPVPFEPEGDRARWQVIYDLLRAAAVGQVVTYDEMAAALNMNAERDRHRIQVAMRRAALEHERVDKRAIDAVVNVGYRIVEAPEHLVLAKRHQRRSTRQLVRGYSKTVNVDLSSVPPEVQHAFGVVAQAFAMQMEFNRRFDVRQKRLEESIRSTVARTERTESELSELRARLERLESDED